MTETEACIALNMVPNLGPMRLRKLLEVFETPQRVLLARGAELRTVEGIGAELAKPIASLGAARRSRGGAGADRGIRRARHHPGFAGISARAARRSTIRPIVLYVWGTLTERDHHAISVVGSRKTSHYGLECAKKLSYQLAYAGLTVVSGLARGIDTAAHQGALAAAGPHRRGHRLGIDGPLPAGKSRPRAKKSPQSGAVVSEFPMTFPPDRADLPLSQPHRRRLGQRAARRRGRAEQRRAHHRRPGARARPARLRRARPDRSPDLDGLEPLIQQGAKLVTSAARHPRRPPLALPPNRRRTRRRHETHELSANEQALLDALDSTETPLDTLVVRTGLAASQVSTALLTLEMKRLVKQLPGQNFVRLGP